MDKFDLKNCILFDKSAAKFVCDSLGINGVDPEDVVLIRGDKVVTKQDGVLKLIETVSEENISKQQCTGKCKEWKEATTEFFYAKEGCAKGIAKTCKVCSIEKAKKRQAARIKERKRKLAGWSSDAIYC